MNDLFTDIIGNVSSAVIIAVVPWAWYQLFSNKPLTSYFKKANTQKTEQAVKGNTSRNFGKRERIDESNNKDLPPKNYYKFSTRRDGGDKFKEFQDERSVALGWPELGDLNYLNRLDEETQREKLKNLIRSKYPEKKGFGLTAGYFVKLLSMKPGDILVIPHEKKFYIYKVNKPYYFDNNKVEDDTAHRVGIDISNGTEIDLVGTELNIAPKFKRAVQNRQTLISLQWYADEIESLINS